MKLVIVESPTKKKTIQKYLGEDYQVEASIGHIRDIAMTGKYNLGVDIYGDFSPTYEILKGKEKVVEQLKELASKAEMVYLASDPDREGEAISWHLSEVLELPKDKYKRLEFHEITRFAIQDAVNNPRDLNNSKINAQEARRIIDRILGFRVSYVLARDTTAPSAGRVQSATLRLVYDRTKEQEEFVPVTSYFVNLVVKDLDEVDTTISLVDEQGEKIAFDSEEKALAFIESLPNEVEFKELKKEEKVVSSKTPFTLSELYQVGNSLYHYSTKNILAACKALFENGYITYPRTDSHRLAPEFINKTKEFIKDQYGEDYVGTAKGQKNNKGQDAHEALRPTDLTITAASLKEKIGTSINKKIYDLIYTRTVQSIMQPKIEEENTYIFDCGGHKFETKKNITLFKGFSILDKTKEDNYRYQFEDNATLPYEDKVTNVTTKAPTDYTEGSLVKKMEETGIGRPSTYATMVNTLLDRGYIVSEKSYLKITPIGKLVAEYLIDHFKDTVVNIKYTSDMESKLDAIENEEVDKMKVIVGSNSSFLDEFNVIVQHPDPRVLTVGEKCPVCGGDLIIRHSKNGEFIGCSNYPNCKYIKPEEVGRLCPDCGAPLIYRYGPSGKFIGCTNYPNCNHTELMTKSKTIYRRKRSS